MTPKEIYYEKTANTIIQNLKKRQIEGYYCKNSAEAVSKAMSFVAAESTVSFGGSMTLTETGLMTELRAKTDIHLLDRDKALTQAVVQDIFVKSFTADTYFMSTNAITLEGELLNIDGNGNRVAALIWGPKQVIILCGMNKVASDLTEAYHRVKNIASPMNTIRLNKKTPCVATGKCEDCYSPDCICSQTVITRWSRQPERIKVILIGEELGY